MAFEQKDGQGSLFRNQKKEQDNHPDYTGSITINGQEYWLSSWLKVSAKGDKYMSLSAKPKDAQPQRLQSAPKQQVRGTSADLDNDIPF